MKSKNLKKPSQFENNLNNMHSFNFLNDKSLVLKRNKYLLTYLLYPPKQIAELGTQKVLPILPAQPSATSIHKKVKIPD